MNKIFLGIIKNEDISGYLNSFFRSGWVT